MIIPRYLSNVGMGGSPVGTIILPKETDKSINQVLAADYSMPMLKRTASTTRLYLRQRRMAKKTKVRKDAPGEWMDRRMNSNAMRAALLASL